MLKSQNIYDMRGKIRLYGHFGIGPSLLRNRELSLGARAVYLYLSTYFRFRDIEDNMVWPNITQMAKEGGTEEDQGANLSVAEKPVEP